MNGDAADGSPAPPDDGGGGGGRFRVAEAEELAQALGGVPVYYGGHVPEIDLPDVALDAVLEHEREVVWIEVHGEVVAYLPSADTSYVLNPLSTLLWRCLDGEATLDEILADIADVLRLERDRCDTDFVPVAAQWLRDGLARELDRG